MNYELLVAKIKEFDKITIFRHINPDLDAFSSTFGLALWIKNNFIGKEVVVLGQVEESKFHTEEKCSDEFVKESLAIICDVSNRPRIDDQRFLSAKYKVKIDHHPQVDQFEDLSLQDIKYAASCEIVAELCKTYDNTYTLTEENAEIIYRGLLTDTLSFKTSNTTANTLSIAAYLASKGIDIPRINREVFNFDLKQFRAENYIRTNYQFEDGLCLCKLDESTLKELDISVSRAKGFVSTFGRVDDFEVWLIAILLKEENTYEVSIRSKLITINDIASKYGGGGHKNASGIKGLTEIEFNNLVSDLKTRISQ